MTSHAAVLILLRWVHIVFGMMWVGMSFFMNFVLLPSVRRMDPATRVRVVPDLLERASFWIRWSSLVTYVTGWAYLLYQCYGVAHVGFHGEGGLGNTPWGQWISVGVILGTLLLINVWFVIRPAHQKVIRWMRAGQSPPEMPAVAAAAETFGRINLYLAVPLIFTMGAASHLPVMNVWTAAGMSVAGVALVAHLAMIADRIYSRK